MATPNDPGPVKKPNPSVPPAKAPPPRPAAAPGAKPPAGAHPPIPTKPAVGAQPAKPVAGQPPARPPISGVKPAAPGVKPAAAPGAKPPTNGAPTAKPKPGAGPLKKPAAKKERGDGSTRSGKRRIGQVLVDLGFIDDDQLWGILDEAKSSGLPAGQVAVTRGLINEEQLLQALAEQNGLKVVNLADAKPQPEAIALVPETMADVYKILPLSVKDKVLTIAIGDPSNMSCVDDLRNLLSLNEVVALLAMPAAIAEGRIKFYAGGKEESIMDVIQELESSPEMGRRGGKESSIDLSSLQEIADAAPVRKLINMVFLLAIKDKASDIHFEPFEDEYKMRYRCDGVLYEMVPPPRHLAMAISSRIKVMSNLDISERRLPQDGRIELNVGGNPVDMRVSILPTMFGESVVVRVLDRTNTSLDLNKIGMEPEMLANFREMIGKPNGIVLVTGPTGAGKTTTLYSALNELNVISEKIITTEDPVEYDIDGLIQVPINQEIGVTFAAALRSILRQDPDKILVGEIRDLETAQIAVQASLTGHIVFSTLHTNDAPSTITRLRDMGLEPFLITATLEGVLAQRLVRKICVDCRMEFEPSAEMLMELNMRPEDAKGQKFYYGRGCDRCNNTGYKGRQGIYELLVMDDGLRDLVSAGASTDELRAACIRQGMRGLRESGLRAIYNGVTTIEEVVRETVMEEN
jgi:type IV pilus assembly protein PilB